MNYFCKNCQRMIYRSRAAVDGVKVNAKVWRHLNTLSHYDEYCFKAEPEE